jgi:hypothetical protein
VVGRVSTTTAGVWPDAIIASLIVVGTDGCRVTTFDPLPPEDKIELKTSPPKVLTGCVTPKEFGATFIVIGCLPKMAARACVYG